MRHCRVGWNVPPIPHPTPRPIQDHSSPQDHGRQVVVMVVGYWTHHWTGSRSIQFSRLERV